MVAPMCRERSSKISRRWSCDSAHHAADLRMGMSAPQVASGLFNGACADESDLPVIGTAVAGDARVLVTGDSDLLRVKRFGVVEIVTVRAFYDRLLAGG